MRPVLADPGGRAEKYWWNEQLSDEKQNSIKHYKEWEIAGKPSQGPIADPKMQAHKQYKKAIHMVKTKSESKVTETLQRNLLSSNTKIFWRCWQGCFKTETSTGNFNVDGLSEKFDIANHLATNFKLACTPNSNFHQLNFKEKYIRNKSLHVVSDDDLISIESVRRAIECIEGIKASGWDNITIEHVKYAHESITEILCTLFNIMLRTGLVPANFGVGVTTAIPKFKGNKRNITADDFRGITINPVTSCSHLLGGHRDAHEALERALAAWIGYPRALLFSTGYMAATGTLSALLGRVADGQRLQRRQRRTGG